MHANEDVDTEAEDHAYDALRYSATSDIANSPANFETDDGDIGALMDEKANQWDPNDPQWYSIGAVNSRDYLN